MPLRYLTKLSSKTLTRLSGALRLKTPSPSVTSLAFQRKLTPIGDVVARIGRESSSPPDCNNSAV